MLWLLRLFPQFRSLETDLQACREAVEELSTEKLQLQDRLDAAILDRDHLWSAMQEALDNERHALRMQINHAVQKAGGGVPYPDSHSLPATAVRPLQEAGAVGRKGRVLLSEAVQQHTQQFVVEMTRQHAAERHDG